MNHKILPGFLPLVSLALFATLPLQALQAASPPKSPTTSVSPEIIGQTLPGNITDPDAMIEITAELSGLQMNIPPVAITRMVSSGESPKPPMSIPPVAVIQMAANTELPEPSMNIPPVAITRMVSDTESPKPPVNIPPVAVIQMAANTELPEPPMNIPPVAITRMVPDAEPPKPPTTSIPSEPVVQILSENITDPDAMFGAQVRAYLLENPEVIIEAMQILEQREAEFRAAADKELVATHADALFNDGYSWTGGNVEGDLTLVEFVDYRCGYCRRAAPEVAGFLTQDGNIRFIIKEFPLLGKDSVDFARFAIATKQVAGDDAYKQVHDVLIAFEDAPLKDNLRQIADELGLDSDAIISAMDNESVMEEITQTRLLAQNMNISGTPTFILGSEMIHGFTYVDQMLQIADNQRTESN